MWVVCTLKKGFWASQDRITLSVVTHVAHCGGNCETELTGQSTNCFEFVSQFTIIVCCNFLKMGDTSSISRSNPTLICIKRKCKYLHTDLVHSALTVITFSFPFDLEIKILKKNKNKFLPKSKPLTFFLSGKFFIVLTCHKE